MAATFVNHVRIPFRQCGQKCHKIEDHIDKKIRFIQCSPAYCQICFNSAFGGW